MKALKIVIVGAGSASFGLNTLATLLRESTLRGSTLALVDTNTNGLERIHRLAEHMNRQWHAGLTIESAADRRLLLDGADFVICTIEVGPREELWRRDWQASLRHGLRQPYAENGGPGGFAHTARNIPHIIDLARDMEKLCPSAILINLSNPLPRLCRAVAKYTSITPIGLCHQIGHGYRMAGLALADQFGLEAPPELLDAATSHARGSRHSIGRFEREAARHLDIKAAGLNHFTWMLDVRARETGEDLYPLLKERMLAGAGGPEPLTRDMLRVTGCLPVPGDTHLSEYLSYGHNPGTKPWERYNLHLYDWDGAARERDVLWDRVDALTAGDAAALEPSRHAHSEGAYEVIHGMARDANLYRLSINVPNNGAITGLPDETIIEAPAVISSLGALPLRVGALPPMVTELCRREAARVEFVVDSAVLGSRELALQALALDPMVDDLDMAGALLDEYLEIHRETLPQFHGKWSY
jgi:alpha-galactosidase